MKRPLPKSFNSYPSSKALQKWREGVECEWLLVARLVVLPLLRPFQTLIPHLMMTLLSQTTHHRRPVISTTTVLVRSEAWMKGMSLIRKPCLQSSTFSLFTI
jgi:hypothetical protein